MNTVHNQAFALNYRQLSIVNAGTPRILLVQSYSFFAMQQSSPDSNVSPLQLFLPQMR